MNRTVHQVILKSQKHFNGKLPPHELGCFLAELPGLVRAAVSMALRCRSHQAGRRPAWLGRAADIRYDIRNASQSRDGATTLYFEAPALGDAAADVYTQASIFADFEQRPDPADTAFDVFGDVLADVRLRNADSGNYDPSLLNRIAHFTRFFKKGPFCEVDFSSRRFPLEAPARFTPDLIESAKILLSRTPAPQRVRIVGQLDGMNASTQRFSVLLATGEKVAGVFADEQVGAMKELLGKRVLVLGTAIYRASGRLLRIDGEAVKLGENEPTIFSRMPSPPTTRIDVLKLRKPQGPRSGINAIIGKWPGDETEQEITAMLEELS